MITIITAPNKFMAAHNFIPYTISSDNTSEPNFNFVIDVNETGGASNPLARLVYPVQPSTNQLTFDIGSVVKNYVSYDIMNANTALFAANTNSRLNYYCDFYELYDVSGIPTLSAVLASDPTTPSSSNFKVATNAVFDFEDYSALAYANCNVSGFGFLNADLSVNENSLVTQNRILTFFDPNRIVAKIQLSTGAGYTTSISLTSNEYLFNINAGKYLIDTSGVTPTGTSYVVRLLTSSDVVVAIKVFDFVEQCSQYETVRLHWLNKLGAFEAYNFIKNSRHNIDIDRRQFKAPLQIGYAQSVRLKTNYNTTVVDRISVNSDWISDELSEYFEQLMTSPAIFLERSATDLISVNITNVNYQVKKFMDDRQLFNISFDIEYTYNRYRQTL
jgi:hypothetical protein